MADTVYEMMIKLGLDHAMVMSGLGAIGTRLTNLHKTAMDTKLALMGIGAIALAGVTVAGIVKITEATKALSRELVNLRALGGAMGQAAASGQLTSDAFDLAKKVPLNIAQLLHIRGGAYSLFDTPKDISQSAKLWPLMSKFALTSGIDMHSSEGRDQLRMTMKAGELMGQITDEKGNVDLAKAERWLNIVTKSRIASHGMVGPQEWFGLGQQGGLALRNMSEEGFYSEAMLLQIMGGRRAGTAQISEWAQMAKGVMTGKTAEGMKGVGLITEADIKRNKKGGYEDLTDDAKTRLTNLIAHDPMDIVRKMLDNLDAQGVKDPVERMMRIMNAFGRQTTQRLSGEVAMNFEQMIREKGVFKSAAGLEQLFDLMMKYDVQTNINAMANAWQNLLNAVAGPNNERIIGFLKTMTGFFQNITDKVRELPAGQMEKIGKAVMTLVGAFALAGMTAVMAALGPAGWLVAGLTTLAALKYENIEKFIGMLKDIAKFLGAIETRSAAPDGHANPFGSVIPQWAVPDWSKQWNEFAPFDWMRTDKPKPLPPEMQTDPMIQQMSFTSGGGGRIKQVLQPVKIVLNLDGRMLGQSMMDILQDLTTHDMQAASPNAIPGFPTPGSRMSKT